MQFGPLITMLDFVIKFKKPILTVIAAGALLALGATLGWVLHRNAPLPTIDIRSQDISPPQLPKPFDQDRSALISKLAVLEQSVLRLDRFETERELYLASVPTLWPVRGFVTSDFGYLCGGSGFHEGIDIAAQIGTPVRAAGDGMVAFSGLMPRQGKVIEVDHGYGLSTLYGHNATILVKKGDRVKRGMVIATSGRTGQVTTIPSLHYQVMVDGVPVDPFGYLTTRSYGWEWLRLPDIDRQLWYRR